MKKNYNLIIGIIAVLFFLIIVLAAYLLFSQNSILSPPLLFSQISQEETNQRTIQEKNIEIKINTDGTSEEKVLWRSLITEPLYSIPLGSWSIQIPKTSKNILIKENNNSIEFTTQEQTENLLLQFQNGEVISANKKHEFEISYIVEKNPITYYPNHYFKRTITRFSQDDDFSLSILRMTNERRYVK